MWNIITECYALAQNGNIENKQVGSEGKNILFPKMVQDYRNRSADICLVMQAVGQAGHFLPMWIQHSLCTTAPSLLDQKTVSAWNFTSTWKFKYLTPRRVLMEFSSIKKTFRKPKKSFFQKVESSRVDVGGSKKRDKIKQMRNPRPYFTLLLWCGTWPETQMRKPRKKEKERKRNRGSILASIPSCHGFDSPEIFLSVKIFWCCWG